MKKYLSKVLASMLIVATICCISVTLFACNKEQGNDVNSEVTIVLKNNVDNTVDVAYKIDLSKANLKNTNSVTDLLNYVSSDNAVSSSKINCVVSESTYGAYLVEIGDLKPSGNQYIAVFTSNEKDKDVSEWALDPIKYNETTLYYSGLGISSMKLEENAIYCFVLTTY